MLLTKLSCSLPINSGTCPVVRPRDVAVLAQGNHWFDRKCHPRLALSHSFVLGIMRYVRWRMEVRIDTMAAISPDHTAVLGLGVLLDHIAEFTYQCARLDNLGRLVQAFPRRFNYSDRIRICLGLVPHIICFVQVSVISAVIDRNIKVDDVTVEKHSLIWDTMANNLVHRAAERLGEVIVIQGGRV